jgi:hypothetical protein
MSLGRSSINKGGSICPTMNSFMREVVQKSKVLPANDKRLKPALPALDLR